MKLAKGCACLLADDGQVIDPCTAHARRLQAMIEEAARTGYCARCHDNAVAEWSAEMGEWVSPCCAAPVLVGGEAYRAPAPEGPCFT